MLGNPADDMAQVSLRIEPVELGRADQAVDRRRTLAPCVRTRKEEIFPAQGDRAQRPFGGVVVDLDVPIGGVARERRPAGEPEFDSSPSKKPFFEKSRQCSCGFQAVFPKNLVVARL